jgi:filamentous hemagglutinin family protein
MNPKIAMQILMKIKDKKASEILGNMQPNKAAQLIEGIANKK